MIYEFTLNTARENMYNITTKVREALSKSGLCVV